MYSGVYMKLLVVPNNLEFNRFRDLGVHSFLVGIRDFSTNFKTSLSVDEIRDLCEKYPEEEIFLSFNKNLFNHELPVVESILKELDSLPIAGIFFYDLAILRLAQELHLKIPIVWNQTHLVTNYQTCNYYFREGVSYALLSSEITLEEMLEIKKHTDMKLMATIFGYPIIAHSKRKLLSNYLSSIQEEKEERPYEIQESVGHDPYLLREDSTGTTFFYHRFLNGTEPLFALKDANFSYGLVYEDGDEPLMREVIETFQNIIAGKEDKENAVSRMNSLIGSYTGFFYKKTIYKVKKNG